MAQSSFVLKKTDGSLVTAQEAFDAYMNGSVILRHQLNWFLNVVSIIWCDINGETDDQNNVGFVRYYILEGSVNIGDESLFAQ